MHRHRRQVIAIVRIAQIGGLLQEDRPRVEPQPELALLVRVQGQVVGLRAVALMRLQDRVDLVVSNLEAGETGQLDRFIPAGAGNTLLSTH